ncbi:hypothetical protein BGP78_17595 [Pseudoalteromonas sp. MSK9-3]|uniref:hypothetical protein n=1 Tax=Pseudoalteromonas sp. MSK9-3 TaxID=1897633 RepID=UPI000E6BEB45|nr:hypothetical protein [Pseudoalteromonas sp. MSK9-3]RJE73788.1 hypothetical protein BGP78_17595 [Pseudoalteromonas sp. MSK9-3]
MHNAVLKAIASLCQEGKTPTVALTKARLSEPVAMPHIIAGITAYKNNPKCIDEIQTPMQSEQPSERESQLDRIESKLDLLLSILQKN